VDDEKVADAVIEQLNGRDFGGNNLRIERSERRDERRGNDRRPGGAPGSTPVARKAVNKVVHSDSVEEGAPDPRWAGELAKLKGLLDNQKAAV
jgi:hypothetical protein